jgi:tetratricopeptide (TPR) repeat protein
VHHGPVDDDLDRRLAELDGSDDVDALHELGCDLAEAGRHHDAEQCFRRAARDGDPVSSFNLGNELSAQERWTEAVEPYERAIAGGETDACFNLGIVLEELGDLAGARRAYEGAVAAGDTKGWVHLAWLAEDVDDRDGAVAAMTSGAATGDRLAAAVLASWRWDATGDPALEEELRLGAERYTEARADLGQLLRRAGRLEEARAVLERGVELGEVPSMLPLGNLLSDDLEDDAAAERAYRSGIAAGDAFCHNNLGVLLLDRGDVAGAAEQFMLGELSGDAKAAANLTALRDDGP